MYSSLLIKCFLINYFSNHVYSWKLYLSIYDQVSTNWTHFGGMPPADEVSILRGQVLLIQNQLMYERQQRQCHAKRCRRLLRRITGCVTLEEGSKAVRDLVQLKEAEVNQLKVAFVIYFSFISHSFLIYQSLQKIFLRVTEVRQDLCMYV